jgi:hypothetical protein
MSSSPKIRKKGKATESKTDTETGHEQKVITQRKTVKGKQLEGIATDEDIQQTEKENTERHNKEVLRYFKMKQKWEEIMNTMKDNKRQKCLICGLVGNMKFDVSKYLYSATCGKKNCSLEIQRYNYISVDAKVASINEKLNALKRRFIIEKMDTMFKFIDDKNTIQTFKNDFEEYRELLKELNEFNNTHNNTKEIDEKILVLNNKINLEKKVIEEHETAYKIDKQESHIDDIVDKYYNKLIPLTDELFKLTHFTCEVNVKRNDISYLYCVPREHKFIVEH